MKTVKAKNRFNNNYRKQVPITINPDFSQNLSNRILFFTSLEPALILMSFASSFHFLAAKYLQDLRTYLVVLTLGNERI